MMTAAEVTLKSPSIPLFQRRNFLHRTLTPLWKRGEREISRRRETGIIWQTFKKRHLQAAQKGFRGEAREKSTSRCVLSRYVGARRSSATKHMSLFQRPA